MSIRLLCKVLVVAALVLLPAVPGPALLAVSESRAAEAVTGWLQVNGDGFGNPNNGAVSALAPFGNRLYAATYNTDGAQIWRLDDTGWTPLMSGGFGDATNTGINDLVEFGGSLYAGTWNETASPPYTTGAQLWRSPDGSAWGRVTITGLAATQGEITDLVVYSGAIYAATINYVEGRGGELWRSSTGDSGSWTRCVSNGFGEGNNAAIQTLAAHGGRLYAGTSNWTAGCQVWRSSDGCSGWSKVNSNGFGDAGNQNLSALVEFNGYLYASMTHSEGSGTQVWRCQTCGGSDWVRVVNNGFGNPKTRGMSALVVYAGQLYLAVGNADTGMEVWRTANGTQWSQVGFAGFGDHRNRASSWGNSVAVWSNRLYVGTWNPASGGELWLYLPRQLHLPVVLRAH